MMCLLNVEEQSNQMIKSDGMSVTIVEEVVEEYRY